MATVRIHPGVCGFDAEICATADEDMNVHLEITSACPQIVRLGAAVAEIFGARAAAASHPGDDRVPGSGGGALSRSLPGAIGYHQGHRSGGWPGFAQRCPHDDYARLGNAKAASPRPARSTAKPCRGQHGRPAPEARRPGAGRRYSAPHRPAP